MVSHVADAASWGPEFRPGRVAPARNKLESFTDDANTRKSPGAGPSVRVRVAQVEMMNGEITVEREPVVGTTVILSLQRAVPKN